MNFSFDDFAIEGKVHTTGTPLFKRKRKNKKGEFIFTWKKCSKCKKGGCIQHAMWHGWVNAAGVDMHPDAMMERAFVEYLLGKIGQDMGVR